MKLLNNTPIANDVLNNVLIKAGRAIGAKTTNVVVQANQGRGWCGGRAYNASAVRWSNNNKRKNIRKVSCEGAFKITLSLSRPPLETAQDFYNTARHEFGHVRDYQKGGAFSLSWSISRNGRRPAHNKRPEEIRAEDYIYESDKKKRDEFSNYAYEVVLSLAIVLEEYQKKQGWKLF
jgi:hypothetical protein